MPATTADRPIRDLLDRWVDAEQCNDADDLDHLLADDFVGVGPRGFVLTKPQWLARYREGRLRNESFELRDPDIHWHGGTTVTVGTQVQQTSYQGHDTSATLRATVVDTADGWRLAAVHLGPTAAPGG